MEPMTAAGRTWTYDTDRLCWVYQEDSDSPTYALVRDPNTPGWFLAVSGSDFRQYEGLALRPAMERAGRTFDGQSHLTVVARLCYLCFGPHDRWPRDLCSRCNA